MSPLASIDIGSNSIRLLVGEVGGGHILPMRYERIVTRLAQGIEDTGYLRQSNMKNSIEGLKGFLEIIKGHGVSHIKAVGTSALREAKNSGDFIDRLFNETVLKVEVISGKKEAGLTAKGVLSGIDTKRTALIIDIGGGSTEWSFYDGQRVLISGTLPTGVVKLLEKYIKEDPPSFRDMSCLKKKLNAVSEAIHKKVRNHIKSNTAFIETAGTATTLAGIDLGLKVYDRNKVHMHEIPVGRLISMASALGSLPIKERAKINGLEPERADLIIPGIHFTIKIMERFGFKEVIVSDCGLLEGTLLLLSMEVERLAL
ncbi:MAG: Ppx/GppA family phosphatase [Nitrospirae bacterium]|nr:Ppx/GppA family phosphatase [Nitrospirota bacterium]